MDLSEIPGRAFLDTSVVNFILDHGEEIHDGVPPANNLSPHQIDDINALYNIFLTGKRASWQLAISPHTCHEVLRTANPSRQRWVQEWFLEVWEYWVQIVNESDDLPSLIEAENMRIKVLTSSILGILPDLSDRILIADALVYGCDCFCTRDWQTILKYRDQLSGVGLPIITPNEWWKKIRPYASLWA